MELSAQLDEFESQALMGIEQANNSEQIEQVRIEFLGAKRGRLKDLQTALGKATAEQKPLLGKRFNEVKQRVSAALDEKKTKLDRPKKVAAGIDLTLPGTPVLRGRVHPLTQTIMEFKEIMGRLGFTSVEGPEIEDEYHNFVALNIPDDHPARDPLDNFYLATAAAIMLRPIQPAPASGGRKPPVSSNNETLAEPVAPGFNVSSNDDILTKPVAPYATRSLKLLRSQTSTVQIRVMENQPPPVRVICVGRVYRPDAIDMTHSCMFHQMEGLMIGEAVTMAQLKTTLRLFATAYLGHDVTIRFRPSFFPFTEPSVEVDMSWDEPGKPWLEIGGAGMVDPAVLQAVGYDPDKYSGFAFGFGVERFCMRRHRINDIRLFTSNDVSFLRQF